MIYIYVYVYVYIYKYIYIHIYTYIYVYVHRRTYFNNRQSSKQDTHLSIHRDHDIAFMIYIYTYIYIYICIHVYIYALIYICDVSIYYPSIYEDQYISIMISIHMYICIYIIRIFICTYMYMRMFKCTYIYIWWPWFFRVEYITPNTCTAYWILSVMYSISNLHLWSSSLELESRT